METVPNSDAYVMVGTYGVSSGFSGIHFIYFDPSAGGIVTSKVFYISNRDMRPVDIAVVDATHFFITALIRDNLTSNGKDRIKILEVDDKGNILMDEIVESAVTTSTGYRNMYPLHSIYFSDQLYICGYIGLDYYAYSAVPYFGNQNSKLAFVLSFDPNTLSVLCNTWDYTISPIQPVRTDYDIAMRMVPIDNDNIYVTGSCNTAIAGFSGDEFPSATLSLFIDKTSLQTTAMTGFSGRPFVDQYHIGAENGSGEFGVGILPDPGGSGGFFVVGNDFTSDAHGTPSNGFAPFPEFYWLTYLDPNNGYFPPTGAISNRIGSAWDYAWLLQSLPGQDIDRFVLAGMISNTPLNSCYQVRPPSFDNYNPFLTEITPGWTGSNVSLSTHWWEFYESRLGTGVIGVNANNYRDLGGGISNIAWNPTFATRQTDFNITSDIMMSAPIFNPNNSVLNFKLVRTDKDGIVNNCDFNSTACEPLYQDLYAIDALNTNASSHTVTENAAYFSVNIYDDGTSEFKYDPDADYECDNSFYKQATSAAISEHKNRTSITPNPASDFIQIILSEETTGNVSVNLTNLVGQKIARLYNGAAEKISAQKLSIPNSIDKGLYFVTITDGNGKLISQTKLLVR